MNRLILKKSKNNFYFYDRVKNQIGILSRRKFKDVSLGIIIDTALKVPPDTGVTYRLYYLSKKLVEKNMHVKIFLCNRNFETDKEIKSLLKEKKLEFHVIPEPFFYSAKKLNEIIKSNPIDILQVEDPVYVLWYEIISRNLHIPFCLEMHDIEASLLEGLKYNQEKVDFRKTISYFACAIADKVICMTPLDYNEAIYKIGVDKNKLTIIPNPIDLTEFPYFGPNLKAKNIIFLGNMFYWPNQNAVEYIAEKIYPKVSKKIKDTKFTLIGMVPKEIKKKYSKNNFIFTGSVSGNNLNKLLKETTIALCPVTEGSGMKVKILNYCAAGLPVLATKIGVSGYEKVSSLIIENNLNKYPEIIIDLLNHPDKMRMIGRINREKIAKYYDLDKIANKTIQTYQDILNSFSYKVREIRKQRNLKLPLPLWLEEKRIKKIKNKNYYIIKDGKITFKKELDKVT
ncbi:MAG: glycosyltransferase family 4 protein [Minisyncoccales bacterium]